MFPNQNCGDKYQQDLDGLLDLKYVILVDFLDVVHVVFGQFLRVLLVPDSKFGVLVAWQEEQDVAEVDHLGALEHMLL